MTGRGSTWARGYTGTHRKLRNQLQRRMDLGELFDCWRCGEPIQPGEPFDLGHDDLDRSIWRGPEHRRCNRATSGRKQPPKRWVL